MAGYVVVKEAGIVQVDGADEVVQVGDLFEADHPAVAKYPNLFGPVRLRYPNKERTEQATRAPGERRGR